MLRSRLALCSLLALTTIAAGCGDSGSSDESKDSEDSGGAQAPKPTDTPKKPAGKADVSVSLKDIQFKPMNVTATKGQTIRWTNDEAVTHNVTKEDGPGADFKSESLNQGDTFDTTVEAPGKINYLCTIHPNQTGTITVK